MTLAGEEEELKTKIHKLIKEKFDGDYQKGFDHYDKVDGEDSKIGPSALEQAFSRCQCGKLDDANPMGGRRLECTRPRQRRGHFLG